MRNAQEATYHFMTVMSGDLKYYEEAWRTLYAGEVALFYQLIDGWPTDIREHIKRIAAPHF